MLKRFKELIFILAWVRKRHSLEPGWVAAEIGVELSHGKVGLGGHRMRAAWPHELPGNLTCR